ncbi:MAG: transposase [Acidobacteriota bacterium]
MGQLDLSRFYAGIGAVEGVAGQATLHPRLLISVWICAYSEGISSAREVSRRCDYQPALQWLTGMERINHHTLSDFRVGHGAALDELFQEVLGVLSAMDLIRMKRVTQDGTKIRAQASRETFRR